MGQTSDPEEQKEFNSVIRENSNKMLKIVNDIVDFSKIETDTLTLNKTNFNVAEVINELKKNIVLDEQKPITFEINSIDANIHADKDRFYQI
jgi:signal transduction histidine kinase